MQLKQPEMVLRENELLNDVIKRSIKNVKETNQREEREAHSTDDNPRPNQALTDTASEQTPSIIKPPLQIDDLLASLGSEQD